MSDSIPTLEARTDDNRPVFQLVSLLMQYPEADWVRSSELEQSIADLTDGEIQEFLQKFLGYLATASNDQLAANYVSTFDFNSAVTLYLTYSAMGEERERGQTLIRIKEFYQEAGYEMASSELPDYLPLILEFVSVAPAEVAAKVLRDFRTVMVNLQTELEKIQSPYASVMQACNQAANRVLSQEEVLS